MRKLFSLAVVMLISMVAMAGNESVENATGAYDGQFTRIYMNGEKDVPGGNYTANVMDNGNGTFNLTLEVPKIGAMPGTIKINAKNITLDANGNFNQTVDKAIQLTMGLTFSFKANVTGSLVNGVLTCTVESVGASFMGVPFSAIIGFTGEN